MTVPAGEQHAREEVSDFAELIAWALKYDRTPWQLLPFEATINRDMSPMRALRTGVDAARQVLALSSRVEQLETLVRQAAPFVNAVAVMADDKSKALGWLADASALASVSAGKPA